MTQLPISNKLVRDLYYYGVTTCRLFGAAEIAQIRAEANTLELSPSEPIKGNAVVQRFLYGTINRDALPTINAAITKTEQFLQKHLVDDTNKKVYENDIVFTECRFHRYPLSEDGITSHSDGSIYKNVIVNILLAGESAFYVDGFTQKGVPEKMFPERLIDATPGWCIVLAAPGLFGRPWQVQHRVGKITVQRETIGLRIKRSAQS